MVNKGTQVLQNHLVGGQRRSLLSFNENNNSLEILNDTHNSILSYLILAWLLI